jgi:hypothetical protein
MPQDYDLKGLPANGPFGVGYTHFHLASVK